ncbi:unnamed protein product [Symbiodinium natans]|uniref:Uncharacterized protein n=1 Tax=Symbiodinium natans TaxID=878477 RepID=A0A812PFB7_9DINO|nr:unnamed protein product [Symbiodinium natans]
MTQGETDILVDQGSQPDSWPSGPSQWCVGNVGTRVAGICGILGVVCWALALLAGWALWSPEEAASSPASLTRTSDPGGGSLDLSELMELFTAMKAHPVGAQALADANRSFGLKRDGLGRRMWEDLPVPVLSDSADVPRFVQVIAKLPEPRVLAEDATLTDLTPARKPTKPTRHLSERALLRQLSEMLNPEARPPTSDIFSPESLKAFDGTTCFFDVYQSLQYVAYAGLMIYYSTIATTDVDLSADVTGVQASVAWVASYLASAFSTCAGGLVPGNCVSNVAWTAGNFPQLASDALSIVGDCSGNQTERFETSDDPLRQFNGTGTRIQELKALLRKIRQRRSRRQFLKQFKPKPLRRRFGRSLRTRGSPANAIWEAAQASCFFDSQAMISFFARFGLQVVEEMKECIAVDTEPAKRECAWGIIYAIDNFGWAIEYILQSINDCQQEGNVDVLCAESIADIVFSGTGMMPAVAWAYRDCQKPFPIA